MLCYFFLPFGLVACLVDGSKIDRMVLGNFTRTQYRCVLNLWSIPTPHLKRDDGLHYSKRVKKAFFGPLSRDFRRVPAVGVFAYSVIRKPKSI